MGHPLTPDLTKMTMDEFTKKFTDLQNRLSTAYRWGNGQMVQQLQLLLQDYQEELNRRNQKQLDDMMKSSKNFKDIIDIK